MGTTTSYVPYDYRRVCDLCGNLFNRSRLHRKGQYTYCDAHAGERISEQLDRANARQKPFRILPVPNAKPDDEKRPDTFEGEESLIFNLIDFARAGGARYANVASGSPAPRANSNDVISVNAWACLYYYGRLGQSYTAGHVDVWRDQLLAHMRIAADALLDRQTLTGTRATNSFWGGFLGAGCTVYTTEDTMVSTLACVYAFRILGDIKYIAAARAGASFLRNCQAIGSCGVNFTSSDEAGTARLYTGAITRCVYDAAGFYSDHLFYPSGLIALLAWTELRITDGDQSIGATAAIAGDFTTAPTRALSASINDLRGFWETGTYDTVTRDVRTGLSSTTPAECFNAYPRLKPEVGFYGTGSWQYQDGFSSTGTTITSLNFAKALWALYGADGASSQVTTISDWLAAFTANPDYATAAGTSAAALQREETGTYVAPTPTTLMLVRDPVTLAPVALNGSSRYDWGAFGLLSPLLSRRQASGFKEARWQACIERKRFADGLPSDGDWAESGIVRGRQGLSYQTGFSEVLEHGGCCNGCG